MAIIIELCDAHELGLPVCSLSIEHINKKYYYYYYHHHYYLTAFGLTAGGSSIHLHTQYTEYRGRNTHNNYKEI
jgi:hypothetical protein